MRPALLRHYYYSSSRGGIPEASDALFHLNGVIEEDSGSHYFSDRTGNGRRFLITNKDFPSDWTIGFPYKSKATISAPVGDAVLIAADVNNYLYDTNGDPNEIPVVSLFQDVDYEHKLFTRHVARVVNGASEETIQPRVAEMVLYNTVKSDTALTQCQSYFSVPTEATSAVKWISKSGNNFNTGTKASPWLTIHKATANATDGDTVYVKSGDYLEDHSAATTGYLMVQKSVNVVCIGRVNITAYNTARVLYVGAAVTFNLKNAVIGNAVASTTAVVEMGAFASTLTFDRCWIKNGNQGMAVTGAVAVTSTNNIFSGISGAGARLHSVKSTDLIVKGCHSTDSVPIYLYDSGTTTFQTAVVQYNKFNSGTVSHGFSIDLNYSYNEASRIIVDGDSGVVTDTSRLLISRNRLSNASDVTIIDVNHNYYDVEISNNRLVAATTGSMITTAETTSLLIKDNILIGENELYAGIRCDITTVLAKTLTVDGNVIISDAELAPIQVGDDVDDGWFNSYSGVIKNNYIIGSANTAGAHGVAVNNQTGIKILHNYIEGYSFGYISKAEALDLSGAEIAYNISVNCVNGISAKGGHDQPIYNNTIINATEKGIYIAANPFGSSLTLGTVLKNNIIYDDGESRTYYNVWVDPDCDLISDNNCIYSVNNSDEYAYETVLTKAQWLALPQDANSIFTNPSLDANHIPSSPILIGENLGATYDTGLDTSTDWAASPPSVVTNDQVADGAWEVGAYVQR